jgi:hypothetical protein
LRIEQGVISHMGQLYPPPSHSSCPPHITVFSFMHAGEADLREG